MNFLLKIIGAIFDLLLDFLFPKECVGCRKNGVFLCSSCESGIMKSSLSMRVHDVEIVIAASSSPLLKTVLHQFKYGFSEELAVPLGYFLKERFLTEKRFLQEESFLHENFHDFVAVPIPLHWKRLNDRGFNQSDLLARCLPIPVVSLLRRHRSTASQVKLSREKREVNVANAFSLKKGIFLPQRVLLVDDVYTTGATISECAKVLKMAGVKEVKAMVLTHGI